MSDLAFSCSLPGTVDDYRTRWLRFAENSSSSVMVEGRFVWTNLTVNCTDNIDRIADGVGHGVLERAFPRGMSLLIDRSCVTLVNRYQTQQFLNITTPTLMWMGSMSSWRYGTRVVTMRMIASVLWHTPTRTLFLYALTFLIPIPWKTSKRRCVASSSMPPCRYLYFDYRSGSVRSTTSVRDSLSSL